MQGIECLFVNVCSANDTAMGVLRYSVNTNAMSVLSEIRDLIVSGVYLFLRQQSELIPQLLLSQWQLKPELELIGKQLHACLCCLYFFMKFDLHIVLEFLYYYKNIFTYCRMGFIIDILVHNINDINRMVKINNTIN